MDLAAEFTALAGTVEDHTEDTPRRLARSRHAARRISTLENWLSPMRCPPWSLRPAAEVTNVAILTASTNRSVAAQRTGIGRPVSVTGPMGEGVEDQSFRVGPVPQDRLLVQSVAVGHRAEIEAVDTPARHFVVHCSHYPVPVHVGRRMLIHHGIFLPTQPSIS